MRYFIISSRNLPYIRTNGSTVHMVVFCEKMVANNRGETCYKKHLVKPLEFGNSCAENHLLA